MITTADAIISLRPQAQFRLVESDIANIEWLTDGVEPLTEAEVDAEKERLADAAAAKTEADAAAREAAIAHAKSLGFTDEMIAVMYPNLASVV